jgi:hypothetical protein
MLLPMWQESVLVCLKTTSEEFSGSCDARCQRANPVDDMRHKHAGSVLDVLNRE